MEYRLKEPLLPLNENYTVVERVFATRGIKPQDIRHYLNTTDADILDPLSIDNIVDGCKMLMRHISNLDKILVVVDSDCDGFTSSSALINYLYSLFPGYVQTKLQYYIHPGKQHGLYQTILDLAINTDCKLIICPDSSSNNYDEHKWAKEHGIDVLVIDHHEAERVSSDACVINNQLCSYPTKSLSGVGMVYKFCCVMDYFSGEHNADKILDLVAIGLNKIGLIYLFH